MMDLLQKFLGSNPQRKEDYADFVRRQQQDPGSITDEEAARRYRELIKHAPPEVADAAHEQAFGQMPPQDRSNLADQYQDATRNPARPFDGYNYSDPKDAATPRNLGRMTQQAENQDPDLFGQIFGEGSPLSTPMGKAALAAGAAYLASRVLSGQGLPGVGGSAQNPNAGAPSGGGLGGLLEGLTGGGGGGGSITGGQPQQTPQGPEIPGINVPSTGVDKQV